MHADISMHYKLTTVEFFVLATVSIAVGGLASFNALIISNGLTNIEIKSLRMPFCRKSDEVIVRRNNIFRLLVAKVNSCFKGAEYL